MATDKWHRAEHDRIRADHPELPAWDDLPEDRKEFVRKANIRQRDYMDRLGDAISTGAPVEGIKW